jgi:hypothetical protein
MISWPRSGDFHSRLLSTSARSYGSLCIVSFMYRSLLTPIRRRMSATRSSTKPSLLSSRSRPTPVSESWRSTSLESFSAIETTTSGTPSPSCSLSRSDSDSTDLRLFLHQQIRRPQHPRQSRLYRYARRPTTPLNHPRLPPRRRHLHSSASARALLRSDQRAERPSHGS